MKRIVSLCLSLIVTSVLLAANTITKVEQVTTSVVVADDVDYVINSATPFATTGSVNITNTDHAVVILSHVKPSVVISKWLGTYVKINGAKAVNNSNCQVKMYASGAIILPYPKNCKPLTVYSEPNFGGTAVNDFGFEHTGGYMNTLTDAKLNNKIRSFKLKRGYMVTFSTRKEGRGYSRCFIADKEDLEFAELPAILDNSISSYRVFVWQDAQKKGVGSDTRADYVSLVSGSWCYDWGTGHDMLPDIECVPNHIYEDWPSSAACGSVTYSCHMKTNNEPGNSADDHPQSVNEVLANWENLMRTGLRLCSESSHDGSMNHLKAFIDSIDARGWRCDILDLHCYWPTSTFNNINWYISNYGYNRPVWISEWVWGASWNNNGAFAVSDRGDFYGNQDNTYNGTRPILEQLNANPRIERYAYWNSEADCSKIYRDKELSKLGKYYADMETGLGYNKAYEYIPKTPRQYGPSALIASYDVETKQVTLRWHERNGEYNKSMKIQYKQPTQNSYRDVQEVELKEEEADYEVTIPGVDGYKYRIAIVDANGKEWYTNEASAVAGELKAGDPITMTDGTTKYLGGNILTNGGFEFGFTGWTDGEGNELKAPYFEVVKVGGFNADKYLQCYGNSVATKDGWTSPQSIRKIVELEPGASYYVSAAGMYNDESAQRISTASTENSSLESNVKIRFAAGAEWTKYAATFTVNNDKYLRIMLRGLGGKASFDEFVVAKVFDTKEEALADALECAKKRVEAFKAYNIWLPFLNDELDELVATGASAADIEKTMRDAFTALYLDEMKSHTASDVATVVEMQHPSSREIIAAFADWENAKTANEHLMAFAALQHLLLPALDFEYNTTALQNNDFSSITGWNTKTGTYTGGDQSRKTLAGKTCWNAWWSTPAAGGSATTMAINQPTGKLAHGFYALEVKALTEHYCITDQHATLTVNDKTLQSDTIRYGLYDIQSLPEDFKWELLTTPFIYVADGSSVTVGFEGSKNGAVDGLWRPCGAGSNNGDNREGWWAATDFYLRFIPAYKKNVGETHWNTICLAYDFQAPEGVTMYELAGITADSTRICLNPVSQGVAGVPYVIKSDATDVVFLEEGTATTKVETNVHGLRGSFSMAASSRYPVGALVLEGNEWKYVATTADRYSVRSFEGYIQKIDNLTKIEEPWGGEFLWTKGLVSDERIEEVKNGIALTELSPSQTFAPRYNLSGQRTTNQPGIVVQKNKKYVSR